MVESVKKEKCTGCKMCADVCPKNAITFENDKEGFWYPIVNDRCINCGLCVKKCPALVEHKAGKSNPEVYSVWSKNEENRITSTSGGAFWEIAELFLSEGGVVVGCRYKSDWKSAEHIIARNLEELKQIKGSKYFQSDAEGIYSQVKMELDKGIKVLFCGSPCQNAAIKAFLGKEYVNLYCMDFICRSINSPKAFSAYIDELEEKYGSKVSLVHLKNKKNGWQSLATQVKFENGQESIKDKNEDPWVRGFIFNDLYTRESCFNCQYRTIPRQNADITIGDFWGIKNQSSDDMFKGISVMLLNTDKGRELFEKSKQAFQYRKYRIEDVLPGNPALLNNPVRTDKQEKFFKLLENHTFSYSVDKCIKRNVYMKIKDLIMNILRKCKKVAWLILKSDIDLFKFVHYNYFCKNIIRKSKARIMPHKNAILDLQGNSKIILSGEKDLHIGINKLKGSKAETHVRMNNNAVWNCTNGADLFYNTVLEIKPNAVFNSGYFSANGGSVIIIHKQVDFGDDVMIGRNVIVYDSDFHTLYNRKGEACNPPKTVVIEDHVWLTSNIIVQKGVTIGRDSLITAYTTVNKDVPPHSIFGGNSVGNQIKDSVAWGRETCPLENLDV